MNEKEPEPESVPPLTISSSIEDPNIRTQIEAFAFRELVAHFQKKSGEVQNIDLMILSDFCRNCLAKWYKKGADEMNIPLEYEDARTIVYGEPYEEWRRKYQTPATPEQLEKFASKGIKKD